MKVKPILFSAPMVRALLDGRKTQTRRVLKPQPDDLTPWRIAKTPGGPATYEWRSIFGRHVGYVAGLHCAGDVLWVREAWRVSGRWDKTKPSEIVPRSLTVMFGAGGSIANQDHRDDWRPSDWPFGTEVEWAGRLRPGMFMPRWASRLTLVVTDVRVQRLNEISEEDAIAEGVSDEFTDFELYGQSHPYRFGYSALWNSINGPDAWDANPWVAAYTFTVHRENVDTFLAEREAA